MEVSDREIWKISTIIEATAEQAEVAQDAIARALCQDSQHSGDCEVPWTTIICRLEDLDDRDKAEWQESFDEDRRRAGEAGSEPAT